MPSLSSPIHRLPKLSLQLPRQLGAATDVIGVAGGVEEETEVIHDPDLGTDLGRAAGGIWGGGVLDAGDELL